MVGPSLSADETCDHQQWNMNCTAGLFVLKVLLQLQAVVPMELWDL